MVAGRQVDRVHEQHRRSSRARPISSPPKAARRASCSIAPSARASRRGRPTAGPSIVSTLRPYSSRYREGMNYMMALPVDGGTPRLIVPVEHKPIGKRSGDGPVWSPDGKQMAYVSNGYLHVMPVTARPVIPPGRRAQITKELADSPSWAGPNQILYIATDRLKLVSVADGSDARRAGRSDLDAEDADRPHRRARRSSRRRHAADGAHRRRHRHSGPSHHVDRAASRRSARAGHGRRCDRAAA